MGHSWPGVSRNGFEHLVVLVGRRLYVGGWTFPFHSLSPDSGRRVGEKRNLTFGRPGPYTSLPLPAVGIERLPPAFG